MSHQVVTHTFKTPQGQQRTISGDVWFELESPQQTRFVVRNLCNSSFSYGNDVVFFEVEFEPPLEEDTVSQSMLRIGSIHKADHVFFLPIMPPNQDHHPVSFPHADPIPITYWIFETHAVRYRYLKTKSTNVTRTVVSSMEFSLENNQTSQRTPSTFKIEMGLDPTFHILPLLLGKERYVGTHFFPLDPDVDIGKAISTELIPQRTPRWYGLRGEVGGSTVSKLLGFWPYSSSSSFDAKKQNQMRFGRIREMDLLLIYMHNLSENAVFHEKGWLQHYGHSDWGCSPDGYIVEPETPADAVSVKIQAAYPDLDITKGVVEFKASFFTRKMEAYFIPQVYWEMMCCGTMWGDLVRYMERNGRVGSVVKKLIECFAYRIHRNPKVEAVLVARVEEAYKVLKTQGEEALAQLVQQAHFVSFRERLKRVVEKHYRNEGEKNPYVRSLVLPTDQLKELKKYLARRQKEHQRPVKLPVTTTLPPVTQDRRTTLIQTAEQLEEQARQLRLLAEQLS